MNRSHARDADGAWVQVVSGCAGIHNKEAPTQAAATASVVEDVITNSEGQRHVCDFESNLTDWAANEKATNRLEGTSVHAPCLADCADITTKHGVQPTQTDEGCG